MALGLALAGFLTTHGAIVWYFTVINREKVPVSVGPFAGVILAGMGLTAAGLGLAPGALTASLFAADVAMGGFILWLLTQRKLPDGELIVAVGDAMPVLTALDQDGAPFDLANLEGQRVMLKFFRGSW